MNHFLVSLSMIKGECVDCWRGIFSLFTNDWSLFVLSVIYILICVYAVLFYITLRGWSANERYYSPIDDYCIQDNRISLICAHTFYFCLWLSRFFSFWHYLSAQSKWLMYSLICACAILYIWWINREKVWPISNECHWCKVSLLLQYLFYSDHNDELEEWLCLFLNEIN